MPSITGQRVPGQPDRILVGIDASQSSKYAVLWAVEEARIRRCALVITHVDPLSVDGDRGPRASAELELLLALSAAAASLRQPAVPVATLLLHGDVTDELVALSRTSSVLVIGVDREARAEHGALGPPQDRLVAHAACPVVAVSNRPRVDGARQRRVVAAGNDDRTGRQVLEAATDEADLRADVLGVAVLPAPVADQLSALLALAHDADLLIVPAELAADRWSIRLGTWADVLIRQSPCPVMLLGPLALADALAA